MAAPTIIKIRRDTWVGWRDANTVLNDGELGLDTTYNKVKVGNGITPWNDLKYGLDFSDIKSTLVPDSDASFDIGTSSKKFRDLYLSNKVIHLGDGVIELDSNNNITTQIYGDDNEAYVVDVINSTVDSAYVGAIISTATITQTVNSIVDSDFIAPYIAGITGFDSGYVQARQDYAYSSLTGAPAALSDLVNDSGFLNTDGVTSLVDSAYVQARQVDIYRDSGFVTGIVDAAYVQANQTPVKDSAFVTGIVDAAYVQARQVDIYRDSAFVTDIVNTAYIQANQVMPEDVVNATYINSLVEFESSFVSSIVDTTYVQTRVPFSYVSNIAAQTIDQDFLEPIIDSAYVQARQVDVGLDSASAISLIDSAYVQARQTITGGGTGLDSAGLEDYLNGKIGTHLIPNGNSIYDLGEPENKFRDLYLSSSTMYIGDTKLSMDSGGGFVFTNTFEGGEGFGGVSAIHFNQNGNGEVAFRFYDPNPGTATWLQKVKRISKGDKLINIDGTSLDFTELAITSNYTYSLEQSNQHYYTFSTDYDGSDSGYIHTFEHVAKSLTPASVTPGEGVGGEGVGGTNFVTFNRDGNGEFRINFSEAAHDDPASFNATWVTKVKKIAKGDKLINIVPYPVHIPIVEGDPQYGIPKELTITSNYIYAYEAVDADHPESLFHSYKFLTDYAGGEDSGWIYRFEHQAAPITRDLISDDISTVIDSDYVVNKVTPAIEASITQNAPEAVDQTILTGLIPTDWEAPVPTTLVEAINRIVTKVKELNGNNPI